MMHVDLNISRVSILSGIHGNCSAHQIRKKVLDNWKTWLGEDWCHPSHKSGAEEAVEVVKKVAVQEKRDLVKEGLENVDKVLEELDKKIEYTKSINEKAKENNN